LPGRTDRTGRTKQPSEEYNGQLSSQADPTQRTADPSEGPTGTSAVLADASVGPTGCLQGPSDFSQKPSAPPQADADKLSQLLTRWNQVLDRTAR